MAFRAELTIGLPSNDGNKSWDFRVLDYHYNINRPIDKYGHPTGRAYGGQCTFVVEVIPGQSLWNYITRNDTMPKCKLVLRGGKDDNSSALKTIEFEECVVYDMTESFSSVGGQPATIQFSISCKKMSEEGAELTNEWNNDPSR